MTSAACRPSQKHTARNEYSRVSSTVDVVTVLDGITETLAPICLSNKDLARKRGGGACVRRRRTAGWWVAWGSGR